MPWVEGMASSPGWQEWNMDKRLSAVLQMRREIYRLAKDPETTAGWDDAAKARLTEISDLAGKLARWAEQLAGELARVPLLPSGRDRDGKAAIDQLNAVWAEDNPLSDAQDLADELDELLVSQGLEPLHLLG